MRNAETLFLVNNGESEIFENDRLLQYLVCADENVYPSLFQLFDYLLLLFRSAVTREKLYINGKMLESSQSGLVMLICQNRRRSEQSTLLARHDALHCRTESDLRLAKADISAEQSLHRARTLHIGLYLVYRAHLVISFDIGKAFLKVTLHFIIGIECESYAFFAFRVKRDKLVRHILYRALDVAARFLPLVGT